jgi:folate-binding protein YgfZ
MTDKQDAVSRAFALPGWQVVEAAGVDAAAFLQAQAMNDVRALEPGRWQWNGWLHPKGRLIALFALAMLESERFWLVLPDFPAGELAARMQRFVFRSKLKLTARADCEASGTFAAPDRAHGPAFDREADGDRERVAFDMGAEGGPRTLFIASGHASEGNAHDASATSDEAHRWAAFDLAHGLPRLPMDQVEAWTPQMLSLDRLHAYSLKKGCYPGQEIVARTHYLGQAKRVLARIVGGACEVGAEVRVANQAIGTVVARSGDEALAVVAAQRADGDPEVAGLARRWESLREGLAR